MEDLDISQLRPEDVREHLPWWWSTAFLLAFYAIAFPALIAMLIWLPRDLRAWKWAFWLSHPGALVVAGVVGLVSGLVIAQVRARAGLPSPVLMAMRRPPQVRMGWARYIAPVSILGLYLCLCVWRAGLGEPFGFDAGPILAPWSVGVLAGLTPDSIRFMRARRVTARIIREVKSRPAKGGAG